MIELVPMSRAAANRHIAEHHKHHGPVHCDVCRVGVAVDGALACVVVAASPTAPEFQKTPTIIEVTRLCTNWTPLVGTVALGAIGRACLALGYRRLVSYTRIDEEGKVYRAANWRPTAIVEGREHDTGNRRNRQMRLRGVVDQASTETIDRVRWELGPDAMPELSALAHLGRRGYSLTPALTA